MDTTRASLLIRIRDPNDSVSWNEFFQLYSPLLYRFARARGLNHDDAEEIRSSCYETILRHIGQFDYESQKGGFKAWLRRMVLNRVIDQKRKRVAQPRGDSAIQRLAVDSKTAEEMFDEQWRVGHLRFCLEQVKLRVPNVTYSAFMMLAQNQSVSEVSERLGLNANQIYKAKSRVLKLVREEMLRIDAVENC